MNERKALSPSHTYVAMCNKGDFSGYYFRKFTMPQGEALVRARLQQQVLDPVRVEQLVGEIMAEPNHWAHKCSPSWYYLNILDSVACIEGVMTFEDYSDLKEKQAP